MEEQIRNESAHTHTLDLYLIMNTSNSTAPSDFNSPMQPASHHCSARTHAQPRCTTYTATDNAP